MDGTGHGIFGSRVGTVVGALVSHQCVLSSIPGPGIMWVEFVVGSLPCSKSFFSRYSGFSPSSKTYISKFQFDLELSSTLSLASGLGD